MRLIGLGLVSLLICCGPTSLNQMQNVNSAEVISPTKFGYILGHRDALGVSYEEKDGFAVVGGDILLPIKKIVSYRDAALGLNQNSQVNALWPNGRVPYQLPIQFEYNEEWNHMVSEWNKVGIQWVSRAPEDTHYVNVVIQEEAGICGSSMLGREVSYGSPQKLTLAPKGQSGRCNMRRTVLHESAHVLGFLHEHQRSDRDAYVKFPAEAPLENASLKKYEGTVNLSPYDINSITHYGTINSFGMKSRDNKDIPLNSELSEMDIAAARMLYFPNATLGQEVVVKTASNTIGTKPSEPTSAPDLAICVIKTKNGEVLFRSEKALRTDCVVKCATESIDKLGLICKWNEDLIHQK